MSKMSDLHIELCETFAKYYDENKPVTDIVDDTLDDISKSRPDYPFRYQELVHFLFENEHQIKSIKSMKEG
jgi:hypothetical protein